jgi:hypothetical protein
MKRGMKGSFGGAKWAEGERQPPVAPKRSRSVRREGHPAAKRPKFFERMDSNEEPFDAVGRQSVRFSGKPDLEAGCRQFLSGVERSPARRSFPVSTLWDDKAV